MTERQYKIKYCSLWLLSKTILSSSNHISSTLHWYASNPFRCLSFCLWNSFFSKPLLRSSQTQVSSWSICERWTKENSPTPSHRYPGWIPNRFGGGGGPLYSGFLGPLVFGFWYDRQNKSRWSKEIRTDRKAAAGSFHLSSSFCTWLRVSSSLRL